MKGIQALHPALEKRATPLQLEQLARITDGLEQAAVLVDGTARPADALRHRRDRALILLGFWRGFRGDELLRLRVEHLQMVPGQGMTCFLARTKGDRQNAGTTYKVPALTRWCPVAAVTTWLEMSSLTAGPVFRRIDRWGHLADDALHPNSLIRVLRHVFAAAGVADVATYSSHSLRRGFAGWANDNGWDVKTLMEYVGWRDIHSAMRYIDGGDGFAQRRIEAGLAGTVPAVVLPAR